MEKKLILDKDENGNYFLQSGEKVVPISNLKVNSNDIYEVVYSDLYENEIHIEVEMSSKCVSKEDSIIYKQIKTLFKKIDEAINKQLSNTIDASNTNVAN